MVVVVVAVVAVVAVLAVVVNYPQIWLHSANSTVSMGATAQG